MGAPPSRLEDIGLGWKCLAVKNTVVYNINLHRKKFYCLGPTSILNFMAPSTTLKHVNLDKSNKSFWAV